MSEQQSEATTTTAAPATTTSVCPHPEAVGMRWGDPISPERQAELQEYLDRWQDETDHGKRKGPFDVTELTGADAYWLAAQAGQDDLGGVPNLHLEGAVLWEAHLEGATLWEAHLEDAHLDWAHLEDAHLDWAHLEGAILDGAHLEGAMLPEAHLERANLNGAYLEGTILDGAHLEGAILDGAHLEGANLTTTWFDKASRLNNAILTGVSLDQISFDNTNLTVVDWSLVEILGDEQTARTRNDKDGELKNRATRVNEYKSAVRANRVLAVALQAQGISEDASRFAYHAQILQREVYRRQRKVGAYLFSLLIAALAGYGYKLGRILIAYGFSLAVFAAAYFTAGQWFGATHLTWYQAILVSLTAIHGRVFFESFGLNSIQSWIAAVESVVGIVIEGVFVAMLIQRFFGR